MGIQIGPARSIGAATRSGRFEFYHTSVSIGGLGLAVTAPIVAKRYPTVSSSINGSANITIVILFSFNKGKSPSIRTWNIVSRFIFRTGTLLFGASPAFYPGTSKGCIRVTGSESLIYNSGSSLCIDRVQNKKHGNAYPHAHSNSQKLTTKSKSQ